MELSLLCDVEVKLIIAEKEGGKYLKYQSSPNESLFLSSNELYSTDEEYSKNDVITFFISY